MTSPTSTIADRGDSLRARRIACGFTLDQLAGLADCAPSSIARIEAGYRPRRSDALARMYAVLDRAASSGA